MEHKDWKGTTGGTTWMQKAMLRSFRVLPLWFVYCGMALVIPFYMLFAHRGYISQYHFFRRIVRRNPIRSFVDVYINHFLFGAVIIDRFAMYAGKKFKMEMSGYEKFQELAGGEKGFLQFSAHMGNYELAGYSLVSDKKPFNALVFGGETETVMEQRRKMFEASNIRMITMSDDMSHVFAINEALSNGEIVSMPCDRIFGSQKTVSPEVMFVPAKLPLGPFATAVQLDVPVISVFVMKLSLKKYGINITRLDEDLDIDPSLTPGSREWKKAKTEALAQRMGDAMCRELLHHSHQWFNFYEFWGNGTWGPGN